MTLALALARNGTPAQRSWRVEFGPARRATSSASTRRSNGAPGLIVAAESAGVELLHYDRDFERIAAVTALNARWLVRDGALA